jgi:TPR repeat protein
MPAFVKANTPSKEQTILDKQNSPCLTFFLSTELKKAIEHCLKEDKSGNIKASETLVQIYSARGELLNYSKAFEWALIASEKGSVNSQAMLGLMYLRGNGTTKNTEKAQYYIQLAIDNGNNGAMELRKLMKRAGLWRKPTYQEN